jgi:hypothetical protein
MSHFTAAVFMDSDEGSIEELLAPYDEDISAAPYVRHTKAELIRQAKEQLQMVVIGSYAKWRQDPAAYEADTRHNPAHLEYLKSVPEQQTWSDEQFYRQAIQSYEPDEIAEDGGILSTYNPSSKWDWYEIGGRWQGLLMLKEGAEGFRGNSGLMTKMTDHYDAAYVQDIDFEAMHQRNAAKLIPYDEAMKKSLYKPEYWREKYPTADEYARAQTQFYTYAVITPDGVWHESGEMGWWGMSSATPNDERTWRANYYDRFTKPALEHNWYLTIVDCHI